MKPYILVGLGEILWDIFPDGPRFGGAPSNFACIAAGLAQSHAKVAMVSAVGHDALGDDAIAALERHGVDTHYVQRQSQATGQVHVTIDPHGVASYRFAEDSAWDHLEWDASVQQLANACDAVCFGTLGQRGSTSRATIRRFLSSTRPDALRILDVNLRPPYHDGDLIMESLRLANVLKLNEDELPRLGELAAASGSELQILQQLLVRFGLRYVALTRGPRGAVLMSEAGVSEQPAPTVEVVDTVGAGDAYTAAMALGILSELGLDRINRSAVQVAASVCTHAGATAAHPAGEQA
jgi:fructokinase